MRLLGNKNIQTLFIAFILAGYILVGFGTAQNGLHNVILKGSPVAIITGGKDRDHGPSENKLPHRRHLPLIKKLLPNCAFTQLSHQRKNDGVRGYHNPYLPFTLSQYQLYSSNSDRAPPYRA